MPDIEQRFPVAASPAEVFGAVSQPALLDQWWTLRSTGQPHLGASYELDFGPEYQWRATVTRCEPGLSFELVMTVADPDWLGTTVGVALAPSDSGTSVEFYHRGWAAASEHYRVSCHCWALYLRVLRRYLEFGEIVPYAARLSV